MATKKLGKGLSSLLNHQHSRDIQEGGAPLWVSPDALTASSEQPRKDLEKGIGGLAESLRRHGMMQPIVVTELGQGKYEILAGERRWRAAQLAGMKQIPILTRPNPTSAAERFELALIENIQHDPSPDRREAGHGALNRSEPRPALGTARGAASGCFT